MHVSFCKYAHKYMKHSVDFDVFGRAQDLKRMTRGINRTDFLTIMQLRAIFQRLILFSMLEFVNEHKNYFDWLMANQKLAA